MDLKNHADSLGEFAAEYVRVVGEKIFFTGWDEKSLNGQSARSGRKLIRKSLSVGCEACFEKFFRSRKKKNSTKSVSSSGLSVAGGLRAG